MVTKKITLLLFAVLFSSFALAAGQIGRVVTVSGEVSAKLEKEAEFPARMLAAGDRVYTGEKITTSYEGSIKLLMTDRSIIDLGNVVELRINDFRLAQKFHERQVDLSIETGKVRVLVNQPVGESGRFSIRTKSSVTNVRGTELIVSVESAKHTEIIVVRGKAAVMTSLDSAASPTFVTSGQMLTTYSELSAKNAEPPNLVNLSQSAVALEMADAKLADRTFEQAIALDQARSASNPAIKTALDRLSVPSTASSFLKLSDLSFIGVPRSIDPIREVPFVGPGRPVRLGVIFQK